MSSWIEHFSDTAQSHIKWTHESALCLFKLWPCSRYDYSLLMLIVTTFHSFNRFLFFIFSWTGNHEWGHQDKSTGARRCPMCLEVGPVVTLCMGCEPAFYVDSGPPTYAFNPCGHMATEKTVKYVFHTPFFTATANNSLMTKLIVFEFNFQILGQCWHSPWNDWFSSGVSVLRNATIRMSWLHKTNISG